MFFKFLFVTFVVSLLAAQAAAQSPEVVSSLGAKFYAQADEKGAVAEAEKKLAADPKNVDLIIELGRAQASVWRYRDAIATYTRGMEIDPQNAMLYRHRGHRYISTRQFDKAVMISNARRNSTIRISTSGITLGLPTT